MIAARRLIACLILTALAGGVFAGCVVVEETRMPTTGDTWNESEEEGLSDEEKLLEAVEDDEEDAKLWFLLGDLYENQARYEEAALAYERMKTLIEEQNPNQSFTAGNYHLGRVFALMKDNQRAVGFLGKVLETQPEDPGKASLNKHYRESHYLLAVIYHNTKQFEAALKHAQAFREIGGDGLRADALIMNIRHAREKRRS
ncbi:MAG: tetratricopeptide repeat protein [Planctomycetota bacterium]